MHRNFETGSNAAQVSESTQTTLHKAALEFLKRNQTTSLRFEVCEFIETTQEVRSVKAISVVEKPKLNQPMFKEVTAQVNVNRDNKVTSIVGIGKDAAQLMSLLCAVSEKNPLLTLEKLFRQSGTHQLTNIKSVIPQNGNNNHSEEALNKLLEDQALINSMQPEEKITVFTYTPTVKSPLSAFKQHTAG